ncbi:hypothetical protein BD626DRAFT_608089 [Schizophyllum amplum]|uniref:Vacuolar protein sorting-associated protein 62 n=1 Tax=Schizophyllum amplum TaxID=97359 RepID=A0A550C3Z0_9AGAR|nr:hypothetical protein BD626DRAFT_608089 [Auriculariopsis ampla]
MMRVSVALAALGLVSATPATIIRRDAIPDYALTYAPYTVIYSGEGWWPSEITTHLAHVTPEVDSVAVADTITLATLNSITADAYLTSNDNVEDDPAWLLSTENTPNTSGLSNAPATIIAADKGDFVDVFYFYFYSYNHGTTFLGSRYGNHVGDWEHTMVRFVDGAPTHVYLSAHSGGYAYTYDASRKAGRYDAGSFSAAGGAGTGGAAQASETVDWLYWGGHWGDAQLPDDDPRQNCIFDIECHYVEGPTGPNSKNLGRTEVCQDEDDCDIQDSI